MRTRPDIFRTLLIAVTLTASCKVHVVAAEPPVTAVAFTPDGTAVVAASQTGVTVWSWPQLVEQRHLESSAPNRHDLAFSPDGKHLAVGGGLPSEHGSIDILSWPEGQRQHQIEAHRDSVTSVAWRNETQFASAGLDHDVVLHDIDSLSTAVVLRGHSRGVTSLVFLDDQQTLVTSGLDHSLRVWDVGSRSMQRSLNNHTQPVLNLSLRPAADGLPMVVSVSADRTVRLWQPTIGRMVRFVRLDAVPLDVRWLSDGSKLVVACTDGSLRIIDPDTVEVTHAMPAVTGRAYSLAVHPTDGSLAVGGSEGQLRRVELKME